MRRALFSAFVTALFLASGLHAQTLDQVIGGCNGVAPLRTIQANPSTYKNLLTTLQPGDRLLLAPAPTPSSSASATRTGRPASAS